MVFFKKFLFVFQTKITSWLNEIKTFKKMKMIFFYYEKKKSFCVCSYGIIQDETRDCIMMM